MFSIRIMKNIRGLLFHWILFISLSPVLCGLAISVAIEKKSLRTEAGDKLRSIHDLKNYYLDSWFDERSGDMNSFISESEFITRLLIDSDNSDLNTNVDNSSKLRTCLENFTHYYIHYKELSFVNPTTGLVEISSNPASEGQDLSNTFFYKQVMESGELVNSDIFSFGAEEEVSMAFAIPAYGGASRNEIIGVLVGWIDLEESLYVSLSNHIGLGNTGESFIVNTEGIVISQLRRGDDAVLKKRINTNYVSKALDGEFGIGEDVDYLGNKVLAVYSNISELKWGLIVKQDISEVYAPLQRVKKYFALIFFVVICFDILIVYWIANRISNPIMELNKKTKKITDGNYSERITKKYKYEVGDLAVSINSLAKSLQAKERLRENVANVEKTIISKTSLMDFTYDLLKLLKEISKGDIAIFYLLNEINNSFEPITSFGTDIKELGVFGVEAKKLGESILKKGDTWSGILNEDDHIPRLTVGNEDIKSFILIPVKVENQIVAIVLIGTLKSFISEDCQLLSYLKPTINNTYSSILVSERTRFFAEYLSKANSKLEAQTTDLQNTQMKLKNHNKELEYQHKKVEEINHELESFSYSVSHDLRAPLRAINSFTKILIEEYVLDLDDEAKRLGDIIMQNAKKMGQLIDDLLSYSRVGRSVLTFSEIDMKSMAQSMFFELTNEDERQGISLNISNLPRAIGDTILLRQLWQNLISNAIKFSSKVEKPEISISFVEKDSRVIYIVKDNGS